MKFEKIAIIYLVLFSFALLWAISKNESKISYLEKENIRIDSLYETQARKDTLYWKHLDQCSFELKEGAVPDTWN